MYFLHIQTSLLSSLIQSNSLFISGSTVLLRLSIKKLLNRIQSIKNPSETTPRSLIAFTRPLSSKNPGLSSG